MFDCSGEKRDVQSMSHTLSGHGTVLSKPLSADVVVSLGAQYQHLIAARDLQKDRGFGGRVVPLDRFADRRQQHRGVRVRFEASRNLRHGRVPWLILADPDEAAAAGDLEGAAGPVDGVEDVHEP